jgi:hypothetical protein
MNDKGSYVIYTFMVGMVVLLLALALAPAISDFTQDAMNVTDGDDIGLNCSYTANISNFDRAACIAVDLSLFYFIGFLICLAGAIVTAKFAFSGG